MAYRVGQILFVIPAGKVGMVPIQVVEEITKKTLSGSAVSYVVRINKAGKTGDISSIDGEIFESAPMAQKTLLERSNSAVVQMVQRAVAQAQEWYPQLTASAQQQPADDSEMLTLKGPNEGPAVVDENVVTLPDGTTARLKLPETLK